MSENIKRAAIIYSGGTDSTCVAALMAKEYKEIHLLTYYEYATSKSTRPKDNINKLQVMFPDVKFVIKLISTNKLVKWLSYECYLANLKKYNFLLLNNSGFTSLSWHIRSIIYCHDHNIDIVTDGITKDWLHFPGHMDSILKLYQKLYSEFDIKYMNPVRSWDIPPNKQFIDELIVNQHDFLFPFEKGALSHTTGKYLFDIGFFDSPDIKGTKQDQGMQHDCFPFVIYNIMAFWIYMNLYGYEYFESKVLMQMSEKIKKSSLLIQKYIESREGNHLVEGE